MVKPLLSRVARADMPEDLQFTFDNMVESTGEGVIIEVFAQHPELIRFYNNTFYGMIMDERRMLVDARTKELLRLKLSKENGCHVCNSFNVKTSIDAGISREQIEHIFDPTPELFNERDLCVLEWAGQFELSNPDAELKPELYARLKEHFNDAQILELGFMATMLAGFTRLMFSLDIVSRDPVCAVPAAISAGRPVTANA